MTKMLLLYATVVCFLLCGCAEISMSQGRFDVPAPHNFNGVGKALPEKSSISNVTISVAYVPKDSLRIRGLYNNSKNSTFEKSPVDFMYNLNRFPVMVSYMYLYKSQLYVAGVSVGVGKFLYGRFIFGINSKNMELGMYGDLGYGFDQGSYDYRYYGGSGLFGDGPSGDSAYTDKYIGHFVTSFGFYMSYYYGSFGVTYSPLVYAPWQRRDLPVNAKTEGDYDINFRFPKIVSQYVGLSYWFTEHWKLSGGVTILTPVSFNDLAVNANTSIGYWF